MIKDAYDAGCSVHGGQTRNYKKCKYFITNLDDEAGLDIMEPRGKARSGHKSARTDPDKD
jgi:hypothetical protein